MNSCNAVSYTHLDVYKRQVVRIQCNIVLSTSVYTSPILRLRFIRSFYSFEDRDGRCSPVPSELNRFENVFISFDDSVNKIIYSLQLCRLVKYYICDYNIVIDSDCVDTCTCKDRHIVMFLLQNFSFSFAFELITSTSMLPELQNSLTILNKVRLLFHKFR